MTVGSTFASHATVIFSAKHHVGRHSVNRAQQEGDTKFAHGRRRPFVRSSQRRRRIGKSRASCPPARRPE